MNDPSETQPSAPSREAAPSPRRSRRRLVGLTLAAAFLLLLVVGLFLRARGAAALERARADFERDVAPLDLVSYNRPEVPKAENAAHWILNGSAAMTLSKEDNAVLRRLLREPGPEALEAERGTVLSLVEANSTGLGMIHRARDLPRSSFGFEFREGAQMEIPNMIQVLTACRLLVAEVRLHLAQGNPDDAIASVHTLRAVAGAVQREPLLLFELLGMALERFALQAVEELLLGGVSDASVLRPLVEGLEGGSRGAVLRRAIGAEAAVHLDLRGWRLLSYEDAPYGEALLIPWFGDRALAQSLDYYRRVALTAEDGSLIELLDDPTKSPSTLPGFPSNTLGGIVDLAHILESTVRSEALRQLTAAAVEVRVAVGEGPYPEDLAAVPAALALAGKNPYTGEPLVYEQIGDAARLSLPGGEALLRRVRPDVKEEYRPRFVVELPALPGRLDDSALDSADR